MKRNFGLIATIVIVLIVLIALNAAGTITVDRPVEDESLPIRSSYNSGPTGTRAFYQLLEESGYAVARWRESYKNLNLSGSNAKGASLIVVGPFPFDTSLEADEAKELQKWVANGGQLLVVSRTPQGQYPNSLIYTSTKEDSYELKDKQPEELVEPNGAVLIAQPTELTRNVRGIAISKLASRLTFHLASDKINTPNDESDDENQDEPPPPPPPAPRPTPTPAPTRLLDNAPPPSKPRPSASPQEKMAVPNGVPAGVAVPQGEVRENLAAPVVHLGDKEGAVLVDFNYGKGRVIFLTDPFVIANNGLAQGANLNLAINLVNAVGGGKQKIFIDEYHHGYHSQGNALANYFRGTPVPWIFLQLLFVAGLMAYSYGKRFARPLPLPVPDRNSPLEFVGSMASLQQAAQARDLALENIYPRFKTRLCRKLGLAVSAAPQTIVAALKRRGQSAESEVELMRTFSDSENALKGEPLDDQRLIDLVAAMRRISAHLK